MLRRLVVLSAALAFGGCSVATSCNDEGCADGLLIHAPAGVRALSDGTLTVCLADTCVDTQFEDEEGVDSAYVPFDGMQDGQMATATLVMADGTRYEAAAELERYRPNGSGCDPVCVDASLALRDA